MEQTLPYHECLTVYSKILESISDGVYVTDGTGKTLKVNNAYEKITGIKENEVIGRNMQELIDEGLFTESVTLHVLNQYRQVTITSQIRTGKEVLVTGTPVFDENGNIIRVITTLRDLEELNMFRRKLYESCKQSERDKVELSYLRLQQLNLENIVMKSEQMQNIIKIALQVGEVNSTVLITGESGVGKEIIAGVIHSANHDNDRSFIKLNCGAIPENLLESELFGYESGAFTGADRKGKPGFFEIAEGGTIFLDEIGEMPISLQVKLLRALQEKEIYRIGGIKPVKIDVRIIAATNKNLKQMIVDKTFREDLFYRLSVIPINIPPLRYRRDDIMPLIETFINRFNIQFKKKTQLTYETLLCLESYEWPGNVRELENNIERLVVLSRSDLVTPEDLPVHIRSLYEGKFKNDIAVPGPVTLHLAVEEVEKQLIEKTQRKYSTTREIAAALGVSQPTIVRKMKLYGLS